MQSESTQESTESTDTPVADADKQQPAQAAQTVKVDDADIIATYANFCRVSSTPEEVVLDTGMNPNPYATGETTIKVSQRLVLNHFTAKRLLGALSTAVQRHEKAFGQVETDVRRRLKSA